MLLNSEGDVFRYVAKLFAAPPKPEGVVDWTSSGLCWAITKVRLHKLCSFRARQACAKRIRRYIDDPYAYAYDEHLIDCSAPYTDLTFRANREARCLAALWLAEEADHDARA